MVLGTLAEAGPTLEVVLVGYPWAASVVGSLAVARHLESLALSLGVAYRGVAWHACLVADHGLTFLETSLEACLGDH